MANRTYEIKQFFAEMEDIVRAAENLTIKTKLRFDPLLFLLWRLHRQSNRSI